MTQPVPCPVCGRDPEILGVLSPYGARVIRCPSIAWSKGEHKVLIYGKTKKALIAAWNKAFARKVTT